MYNTSSGTYVHPEPRNVNAPSAGTSTAPSHTSPVGSTIAHVVTGNPLVKPPTSIHNPSTNPTTTSSTILRDEPVSVYYYCQDNLSPTISRTIREAMEEIEQAAPGIRFCHSTTAANRIRILSGPQTRSSIGMIGGVQDLMLANWVRKGHVLHELMHALGFQHEDQRGGRDLKVRYWSNDTTNHGTNNESLTIGRYDADSIMHYACINGVMDDPNLSLMHQGDHLSNGDKAALNRLYPYKSSNLSSPKKGTTGLYYCGRHNMENNNAPFGRIAVDGYCGPNDGPNCLECRRYGGIQRRWNDEGRQAVQGATGLFYCGVRFTARPEERQYHDGFCGPNNGPSCDSCARLLM